MANSVTIFDVAKLAKVSPMTVSRALRQPELVSDKTRLRIQAAVEQLGYVPNAMASGIRSNRSNIVAVVVPNLQNPLFSAAIHGLMQPLRVRNISVLVCDAGFSLEEEERVIEGLMSRRPAGIVLHSTTHTEKTRAMLRRAGVAVVEIGDLCDDPIDSVISYSNERAAYAMTEHLLHRGYRRIGFVSMRIEGNERASKRKIGYMQALADAGIDVLPSLMIEVGPGYQAGARSLVALKERDASVDAVFFSGDVHGVGAILECNKRGWKVPEHIAIAGFDDYEIADQISPGLTTLTVPRQEIGQRAGEFLLARLDGVAQDRVAQNIGFSLSVRAST